MEQQRGYRGTGSGLNKSVVSRGQTLKCLSKNLSVAAYGDSPIGMLDGVGADTEHPYFGDGFVQVFVAGRFNLGLFRYKEKVSGGQLPA